MKRSWYRIAVVAGILLLCVGVYTVVGGTSAPIVSSVYPPLLDESLVRSLPQRDASGIDTSHLGDGVTPPTNKWFSGIALQQTPQTVFPTPLSVTPANASFTVDLPRVTTTDKTIMATPRQPVRIEIEGATHYRVTRYDELSVDMTFYATSTPLGVVTLVAGLPYVYYVGVNDSALVFKGAASSTDTAVTFSADDVSTGLVAYDGARVLSDRQAVRVPRGGAVTAYVAQANDSTTVARYATTRVTGTKVSYVRQDNTYKTTISYVTVHNRPTYFGSLPHQRIDGLQPETRYDTIYGQLAMRAGTELSFTTDTIAIQDALDIDVLRAADKELLAQVVRKDINTPRMYPEDSYFGGKALYRDAQLLQLATQLGETEAAATMQTKLRVGLTNWLQPGNSGTRSFYYDTKIRGIVGVTPSFGAEAFNDHHFHFGYFIYAASILAKYDEGFRTAYSGSITTLIADIANYRSDNLLPLRRVFDPYFGHSWASGSAPFADGNNQESVSEAINAWVGVALWARQTDSTILEDYAGWLLSNEAASASSYWLNFDRLTGPYTTYGKSIVSLNWGGKRDYATFFSADPRAMLGIVLIPMNPTMQYMSTYGERITTHLTEARVAQAPSQFEDYLLMYESLSGATNQLERAKQLPDSLIDDANSRSYMYAWIMTQQ